MKNFDFSAWTVRDIAVNTLTGGGLNFDNIGFARVDGRQVLCLSRRTGNGARIKFMDAFEEAAAGNTYRITTRVKLGEGCAQDTANITVGVMDPMKWTPDFCSEPVTVGKDAFVDIDFTYTLPDATQNSISVEQKWQKEAVAEDILIESVTVELVSRTDAPSEPDTRTTVWLVGDSITCYYDPSRVTNGWGMHIGDWFEGEKIRICNLARGGFSTKSFVDNEGLALWTHICRNMKAGDYLMVSHGINDHSSARPDRHTSLEEYAANLGIFVDEAAKRGVTTYLITPTVTVENDPPVNFRRVRAEVMLRVAEEKAREGCDVVGLDLNARMMAAIEDIVRHKGYEYLVSTYYVSETDKTHQREAGSRWIAAMIAELLKEAGSPLAAYGKSEPVI